MREKSGENIFLVNNALHPLLYPLCPIGTSYMVTFILASTNPSYGIEPCNAHPWCSQVSSQPHTKKSESVSTKLWFSIMLLLALFLCQIWLYFFNHFPVCLWESMYWVSVWNWWRNVKNRATRDWLASGQPAKGHVRSTCWKLKSQVPKGISRLGQLA